MVQQRDIPEGPRVARQDGGLSLLRRFHAHPAVVRDRGQAALGRYDDVLRLQLVGEEGARSLLDTVQTIDAMGVDAIVVRHSAAGAAHRVASWTKARKRGERG